MKSPLFIFLAALPLALGNTSHAAAQATLAATPNILLILADDLGYGDVSCYNGRARVPTPNLDRLAREGMRFTDAHSPATVCTPSRYSLMTGQMAFPCRMAAGFSRASAGRRSLRPGASRCRPCSGPTAMPPLRRQMACRLDVLRQGRPTHPQQRRGSGPARGLLAPHRRRAGGPRLRPLLRHGVLSHHRLALRVHRKRPHSGAACRPAR